jgi:hypothetical protein
MKLTSLFFLSLPPAHSLPRSYPRASVFILGLTLLCTLPARADIAETVSNDPFDSTRGTVVLNHDVIIDPINAFRTHGGFEDGHTLMRNGGIGSVSFIEFQTGCRASIEGVRLVAANDGAANSFRRSLSRFQLRADLDDNGSFETLVVDTGTVNPDYSTQPGNASANPQVLDLTLTNIGGGVISAQHWRLEPSRGSDVQPFEGARIIEVDALAPRLSVTNTNDSGPGSLRQAILDANTYPCSDTITFDIPGPAPHVIKPLSNLPVVSDPVRIDGTTQPGYAGRPVIELNGALSGDKGLEIQTSNSVVAGLALTLFDTALALSGSQASGNWVYGNHIGLDPTGTNIAANTIGIGFGGGMHHNLIGTDGDGVNDVAERNLISGNTYGFVCYDSYSNRVAGNYIGTDVSGTLARGNSFAGFYIDDSATGNIIGTDSSNDSFNANERNVISGNGGGILLAGPNRVSGNFIGTDPTGAFAVPNAVGLQIGGIGALVGSNGDGVHDDEERNVISGNSLAGMIMGGPSTRDVVIRGNYFGTDASGALACRMTSAWTLSTTRPTRSCGQPHFGERRSWPRHRRRIVGHPLVWESHRDRRVRHQRAGQRRNGRGPLRRGEHHRWRSYAREPQRDRLQWRRRDRDLGSAGDRELDYRQLHRTRCTGTNTASNGDGIDLDNGAHHNVIGSNGDGADDAGERNVISGNSFGVVLYHCFTNRIAGNFIGTDRSGRSRAATGMGSTSIPAPRETSSARTEATTPFNAAERNIISGNNDRGLVLSGPNRVSGNFIGTDVTGTFPVPNQFGVQVTEVGSLVGSDGNGVRDDDERNVISGNSITGVIVRNEGTRDVVIRGNYIGTDVTGQFALPNDFGLTISDQVTNTLVRGNLVSGNSSTGVGICCDAFGTAGRGQPDRHGRDRHESPGQWRLGRGDSRCKRSPHRRHLSGTGQRHRLQRKSRRERLRRGRAFRCATRSSAMPSLATPVLGSTSATTAPRRMMASTATPGPTPCRIFRRTLWSRLWGAAWSSSGIFSALPARLIAWSSSPPLRISPARASAALSRRGQCQHAGRGRRVLLRWAPRIIGRR